MKLVDTTVTKFTELLASPAPAPGGGGASAAVCAIGIALGDMAGELTVGKKKYADVEENIRTLMARAQELRKRLLELVDEDGENFTPLSRAYGIPKDAPGRDEELERCLKLAVSAPLEIFDIACETIDIQEEFAGKCSKLMISDAATGAVLCCGALQGAAVNVKVNTKLMKDRVYAEKLNQHIDEALGVYTEKAKKIYDLVYDQF